jgi:hypothetical protein
MHTKLFLCLVFVLGIALVGSGCVAPLVYEIEKKEKEKKKEKQEEEQQEQTQRQLEEVAGQNQEVAVI